MNELALFAGAGGGILGGHLLGWRTVCAVEWEPYAASVLAARQNDDLLPPFPVWDDVRTFDGRPWRGVVDVVSGGFPCQDISVAGKGAGIDGARSGMWSHMARIVGEVRPSFVFVENSPALLTRGLGRVLSDLATLGYDCRWTVLGAADVGAPHQRDRFWLVGADTMRDRCEADNGREPVCDGNGHGAAHAAGWQEQQPRTCSKCGHVANAHQQPGHKGRTGDAGQEQGRRHADRGIECKVGMADPDCVRQLQPQGRQPDKWGWPRDCGAEMRDPDRQGLAVGEGQPSHDGSQLAAIERADWWESEPDVGGTSHGLA